MITIPVKKLGFVVFGISTTDLIASNVFGKHSVWRALLYIGCFQHWIWIVLTQSHRGWAK